MYGRGLGFVDYIILSLWAVWWWVVEWWVGNCIFLRSGNIRYLLRIRSRSIPRCTSQEGVSESMVCVGGFFFWLILSSAFFLIR